MDSDEYTNQFQNYIKLLMQQKIEDLITEIQVKRQKSRDSTSDTSSEQRKYRKKWSFEEENLLCDLIVRFGTDFTLLKEYFPQKTRQQIKKKYRQINNFKQRKLDKIQSEFLKERRKSFFDEEILEEGESRRQRPEPKQHDLQQQSFL